MAEKKKIIFEGEYWVVTSSSIHNRGLFAKKFIPQGEYIIEYLGEKISKEESYNRAISQQTDGPKKGEGMVYIFEVNDEYDIDGNIEYNPAKYANHHCEPNCEAVQDDNDTIWFCAARDIEKGEELTFDYGYAIDCFLDHPCLCGAPSCPGYIVRKDQRWRVRRMLKSRGKKLSI